MLYLTLLFLIFLVFLTYKNLNNISTRFLYGIIIGWTMSIISLILYLSKHNYYYYVINKFFHISQKLWNTIVLAKLDIDLIIRMFNSGIIIFYYCLLCFSIAFTSNKRKPRNISIYVLLLIIPAFELVFYDPFFLKKIHMHLVVSQNSLLSLQQFKTLSNIAQNIFQYINFGYLSISFYILFHYYTKHPNIKFLKNYTLYNILCLLPIGILYVLMFSWAPKILVKPTLVSGYYNYIAPDLSVYIKFFNIFPYFILISLTFMAYAIYKYNSIETYYKNHNIYIKRSIDTAALGIRTFTHTIKNHILAIQSETEILQEKFLGNAEASHSLDLILDSCTKTFESMNAASSILKNIELYLQPTKLDIPIKKAVSRISPLKSDIRLKIKYCDDIPSAYIDTHYMIESLYNILDNAIAAIGENKKGIIKIILEEEGDWSILSISDNGCGIKDENLEKIFSPFYSTKSPINNWGIGLSYVHKIITAHDGKISVESKEGKGSTFKIILPTI